MKISRFRKIKSFLLIIILSSFFAAKAEKKTAEEVFDRLINIQFVVPDIDVTQMCNFLSNNNLVALKENYRVNLSYLKTLSKFFDLPTNDKLEKIFESKFTDDIQLRNSFCNFYDLLQNDIPKLINNLNESDFCKGAVNSKEEEIGVNILMSKYQLLLLILLNQPDSYKMSKFLLAAGNNLFRFCFCDPTFDEYKNMLLNKTYHPIIKFLHTNVWYTLISVGWKWWHQDCIKSIKSKTDKGVELVYIAGGCDIYQPIKSGIYNIRIIDPMLPSQERFYSKGWKWLVQGDIGDEIEFVFADKKIILKRAEYKELGRMWPRLSTTGQTVELPRSITVWEVYGDLTGSVKVPPELKNISCEKKSKKTYRSPGMQKRMEMVRASKIAEQEKNQENNNEQKKNVLLGRVIFERRFATQDDFIPDPKKVFLMSTTEMISSIDIPENKGWGIDSYKFDDNFRIHVKQLKSPINSNILRNIRFACENLSNLKYVRLTSDPT